MKTLFDFGGSKRRQQALDWLEVLHADDMPEDQLVAYNEWMEADPRNAEEFRRMDGAWIASEVARNEIRSSVGHEVRSRDHRTLWPQFNPRFGLVPQFAAVCGVVLVAVFALSGRFEPVTTQQFATAVGERRVVDLPDGTQVSLNTNSEIAMNFTESLRSVELLKGQAYFNVASNPERPFVVQLDTGNVEVVGTVFDVFRKPDGFAVTVLEGRVAVSPSRSQTPNGSVKTLILKRNERTEVTRENASLVASEVDADAATAWQTGQLVFRSAPLAEILAELGRYTDQNMKMADADMASIEFTGVLALEDADLMATRLAKLLSLRASVDEDGNLLITRSME